MKPSKQQRGMILTRNSAHKRITQQGYVLALDTAIEGDAFLRLEAGRKPRRKPITLARVSIQK